MPPVQVVTLDLWQTLIVDKPEWARERSTVRIEAAQEALQVAGEQFSVEQVREAYRACMRHCREVRAQERDVSFLEQVQTFVRNIDGGLLERVPPATFHVILNRYADSFLDVPPALADGVEEMLGALKLRGYRLGLISNTGATPGRFFRAYLENVELLGFFDHMTFSDEMLLSKPAAGIFLHTLASLGVQIPQAVHVGDHLRNDVFGAKRIGLRAVWLRGFDDREMEATPDATIDRLQELPEALDRLGQG